MFLHEELLKMCKEADVQTPEEIQQFYNKLCQLCAETIRSKINEHSSDVQVKTAFDQVFNSFNLFVANAKKSGGSVAILGELFEQYPFKEQFLKDPQIEKIYSKLSYRRRFPRF